MTQAYPLAWPAGWPRMNAASRKRAQFKKGERQYSQYSGGASYMGYKQLSIADATKRVLAELERLGVQYGDAVVSSNLVLRLDGLPRAGQSEPDDPGVAVYWQRRTGERKVMAIDRYDRVADNLAAIAATLEAMRAIERHGGAQILDRAFTGFDALPAPKAPHEVLGIAPTASPDDVRAAYKRAAMKAHPDHGGSTTAFQEVQRVYEALTR